MVLIVLAVSVVVLYFAWSYLENFAVSRRPPGPLRYPPFGNLIQMMLLDEQPHIAMHKLSKTYGDIMSLRVGVNDTVVVSSYVVARHLFAKEETFGRLCTGVLYERCLRKNNGMAFASPPGWNEARSFCKIAFKKYDFDSRLATQNVLLDELVVLLKTMEEEAAANSKQVDIFSDYFNRSYLNIMMSYMMGKRFDYEHPDFQELLKHEHDIFKNGNSIGSGILVAYPFLRFIFPKKLKFKEQMEGIQGSQKMAKKFLADRKKTPYLDNPECFTDEFLIKMHNAVDKDKEIYTEDHYSVLFMDFLQGGTDTTSNVINFTILHLAAFPIIQEKVYREICDVIGTARYPSLEDKVLMPYTQAVLLEALRWTRVSVFNLPRTVVQDLMYRDFHIRKGSVLLVNTYSILFDGNFAFKPNEFIPERFLDNEGNLEPKMVQEVLITFGTGKRVCFGQTLARDSQFMFITMLIQRFKFSLPEGYKPDLEPATGLTFHAKPYKAILSVRE